MGITKKSVPLKKDDAVKVSRNVKEMIVNGSQMLKQTEKQFTDIAVAKHYATLENEKPLIDKMKEVGLI